MSRLRWWMLDSGWFTCQRNHSPAFNRRSRPVDSPLCSDPLRMSALIDNKALTKDIADMLQMCVTARLNLLISGGTGAGKTTLLNALSAYIPENERIVTIEDSAELQLQQPHVVRLETRPPNIEGRGEVSQRDLVRNALRMRPDRIVIGEVRGGEAIGYASGDEHRSRWQLNDRSRKHPRLTGPSGNNDPNDWHATFRSRDAPADRLRVEPWCRWPGFPTVRGESRRYPKSPAWKARPSPCRRSSSTKEPASTPTDKARSLQANRHSPALCRKLKACGLHHHAFSSRRWRANDHTFPCILVCSVFSLGAYLIATHSSDAKRARLQKRLADALLHSAHTEDVEVVLARNELMSEIPFVNRFMVELQATLHLKRMLDQADLHITPSR